MQNNMTVFVIILSVHSEVGKATLASISSTSICNAYDGNSALFVNILYNIPIC